MKYCFRFHQFNPYSLCQFSSVSKLFNLHVLTSFYDFGMHCLSFIIILFSFPILQCCDRVIKVISQLFAEAEKRNYKLPMILGIFKASYEAEISGNYLECANHKRNNFSCCLDHFSDFSLSRLSTSVLPYTIIEISGTILLHICDIRTITLQEIDRQVS